MINEDKIREVWASNPERGFKLLIDFFQQPIYWHIRRLVVSHEDAEDILQEVFIRVFRHLWNNGNIRAEELQRLANF
jgi:RNA polymerase sigma-70 factor, ECF subfamily